MACFSKYINVAGVGNEEATEGCTESRRTLEHKRELGKERSKKREHRNETEQKWVREIMRQDRRTTPMQSEVDTA